jgi:hypothetical protein
VSAPARSPRFLGFEDAARLAGQCQWFEMRLFEVLGGWAESEDDPRAKLLLRAHSFRHAWHGDLWKGRLPVSGPLEGPALTAPAGDGVAAVLEGLASARGPERLAGLYRVVMPHLVTAYTRHLEEADPAAEAPTVRWLRLIVADEVAAWREGERLLEDLVAGSAEVDRAGAEQSRMERLVVAAGAIPSSLGLR